MRRCEAPIDNKNLLEDAFEDDVFRDGFMQAADHRRRDMRHLVGIKEVRDDGEFADVSGIVDVRWCYGDNCVVIRLLAVSGAADTYDWEDGRKAIFDDYRRTFKAWEGPENPDLRVEFGQDCDTLSVLFYWECD